MSEIRFSDNCQDLSNDNGFQFEFYCEHCREAWRSRYESYTVGTVENLLGAAEGIFGGFLGTARDLVGRARGAGWSKARDGAMEKAVTEAKGRFHRCPRCANYHCDQCWNADEGTCISCVPRLDPELATIRREAKLQKAREEAYEKATVSSDDLKDRVISCPQCAAPVGRGKFCPECGSPVSLKRTCGSCEAEVPTSAKFCPECGAKA